MNTALYMMRLASTASMMRGLQERDPDLAVEWAALRGEIMGRAA